MFNKKLVTLVSGVVSLVVLIVNMIGTFRLCGAQEYGSCMDIMAATVLLGFPVLSLFLLSLIFFSLDEVKYNSWIRFSTVYIPLSMLLIALAPQYSHDWMYGLEKGPVALGLSVLFVLASLFIILVKSRQKA